MISKKKRLIQEINENENILYKDESIKFRLSIKTYKEGQSKYYNNALYPIDIHAPSQLIITLAKCNLMHTNKSLVDKVLNWTIKNMQSPKGYFFYQKRKYYTNKIPYMRWSQAWIFYGLTHYISITNND